jgi:hypothetical protein
MDLVVQFSVQHELWWSLGLYGIASTLWVAKYYTPLVSSPQYNEEIACGGSVSSLMGHRVKTVEVTKTLTVTQTKELSTVTSIAWKTSTEKAPNTTTTTTTTAWKKPTYTTTSTCTSTSMSFVQNTLTDTVTKTSTYHRTTTSILPADKVTVSVTDVSSRTWTTTATSKTTRTIDSRTENTFTCGFPHTLSTLWTYVIWALLVAGFGSYWYMARQLYLVSACANRVFRGNTNSTHYKSQDWYELLIKRAADAEMARTAVTEANNRASTKDEEHKTALKAERTNTQNAQNKVTNLANAIRHVHKVKIEKDTLDNQTIQQVQQYWEAEKSLRDEREQEQKLKEIDALRSEVARLKERNKNYETALNKEGAKMGSGIVEALTGENKRLEGENKKLGEELKEARKAILR